MFNTHWNKIAPSTTPALLRENPRGTRKGGKDEDLSLLCPADCAGGAPRSVLSVTGTAPAQPSLSSAPGQELTGTVGRCWKAAPAPHTRRYLGLPQCHTGPDRTTQKMQVTMTQHVFSMHKERKAGLEGLGWPHTGTYLQVVPGLSSPRPSRVS